MIVPASRLPWFAALVAIPAATLAGLFPGLAAPCWGVLAVAAAVAAFDGLRGQQRVDALRVRTPAYVRLTKDSPGSVPVTIENASGGALSLRLAFGPVEGIVHTESEAAPQPSMDLAAPAGASLVVWPCTGTARGEHRIEEVHLETASPLGLWSARARRPIECALRVYPNLRDRATAALFLKTGEPGARLRRQIGKGKEFENLRHYAPGDSFEDVHWKATARRGFPMVKLYNIEHAQEVYAVIDSSRLSARQGILESYVDAALHLALVANRQRDRFGLVAFSDRTRLFLRARNGMDHFRLCREAIYKLNAERVSPDFREVFTTLATNLRRRALLVFLTSLDDALLAETFEREVGLLARRHLVLVNVPSTGRFLFSEEPADLDAAYQDLAGQMAWNRMRQLQIGLLNRGVRMAFVDPGRAKLQIAAGYLEVKRRQAL
jgi:uncharacterized protein (DUF58 family)